jgi:hypothetical protein
MVRVKQVRDEYQKIWNSDDDKLAGTLSLRVREEAEDMSYYENYPDPFNHEAHTSNEDNGRMWFLAMWRQFKHLFKEKE